METEYKALPVWRVRLSLLLGLGGQALFLFALSRAITGRWYNLGSGLAIQTAQEAVLPVLAALGCVAFFAGILIVTRVRLAGLIGMVIISAMLLAAYQFAYERSRRNDPDYYERVKQLNRPRPRPAPGASPAIPANPANPLVAPAPNEGNP